MKSFHSVCAMNSSSPSPISKDPTFVAQLSSPLSWIQLLVVIALLLDKVFSRVRKSKCCGGEIDMKDSGAGVPPPPADTEEVLTAKLDAVRRSERLAKPAQ